MSGGLTRAQLARLCGVSEAAIPHAAKYDLTRYTPPGPIGGAYIKSTGPIDVITGPAGSGKTTASIFKLLRFSVASAPLCRDGRVKVRGTVIRDNYRALYRTTLRTWFEFLPPTMGEFSGGQDRPAQHVLKLATIREVDGVKREVPVDLTVDFFAVGDVLIEELLKGYETTWGYCNEADLLHPRVPPFLFSRTGRYPPKEDRVLPPGVDMPRMVACDMNPPDSDHPIWKACERGTFNEAAPVDESGRVAPGLRMVHFFHQPSGLSAEAENRAGKSRGDYELELGTMNEEDARRFVHGQPGYAIDGRPVYGKEFDFKRHVADDLRILPGLPLHMGFDQGLSPGVVLFQQATTGQIRIYDELVPDQGTGISRFLEMLLPLLMTRFPGLPPGVYGSDPAGFYGADRIAGEMTWSEAVGRGLGHPLIPAPTNEPALRIEAVKLCLAQMIDANTPALLVDRRCRKLIGGFIAHYKFRRVKSGSGDRFEDRPLKNDYATAHDALQYGILAVRGRAGVINAAAKAGRAGNVVTLGRPADHSRDFSVWDT